MNIKSNELKQITQQVELNNNIIESSRAVVLPLLLPQNEFRFDFIDLFAGIGGIRRPFQKLGGKCVFSSEIDKFARETYQANWGDIPSGDIIQIKASDIPKFDILLAGFPCQAFSVAGKRKGFDDIRGTMFFEVARIIKHHRPKCFMLENVKGLLSHDKGKTFATMIYILQFDLGYKVYYKVLNAKDFGVPQNRARVIIVGFREHSLDFEFPQPLSLITRVGDILESKVDEKYTLSNRLWESQKERKEKHRLKGNGFGYSLFNENSKYTNTISARYYKDGSEILIEQNGKNPRRLTPREACRLQGFDDNFKIVCSDLQAYKQFGNTVPTKMIEAVANNIIVSLRGY
ncbi:MAG: DNA cytosine methyltransferase [Firmicutes bacterium]|nr:DNA cytosine methyltransferase [Bacillota bacterium]